MEFTDILYTLQKSDIEHKWHPYGEDSYISLKIPRNGEWQIRSHKRDTVFRMIKGKPGDASMEILFTNMVINDVCIRLFLFDVIIAKFYIK